MGVFDFAIGWVFIALGISAGATLFIYWCVEQVENYFMVKSYIKRREEK